MADAHPLHGASLRVERADKHIGETQRLVEAYGRACEPSVELALHTDGTGHYFPTGRIDRPRLPDELPLALSDSVHNLRAALDYLVYELARHDSGAEVDGTQFVIADAKDGRTGFDEQSKRRLKGLSPTHVAAIEGLQPYSLDLARMGDDEVAWTRTLRDISNPDKHRKLAGVFDNQVGTVISIHYPGLSRPGRELSSGQRLQVDPSEAVSIALPKGRVPLIRTLRLLQLEVTATIDGFKPEFG